MKSNMETNQLANQLHAVFFLPILSEIALLCIESISQATSVFRTMLLIACTFLLVAGNMTDNGNDRMPLDSFTKSCPPGWQPKLKRYPFRRYMQLLRLWRLQTDMDEEKIGPAICGRLKGIAFQYAMNLSADRLDMASGTIVHMRAPEIFAEPQLG